MYLVLKSLPPACFKNIAKDKGPILFSFAAVNCSSTWNRKINHHLNKFAGITKTSIVYDHYHNTEQNKNRQIECSKHIYVPTCCTCQNKTVCHTIGHTCIARKRLMRRFKKKKATNCDHNCQRLQTKPHHFNRELGGYTDESLQCVLQILR